MKNATLVIMAAGIGSRFGGGIKQLEPVGPSGEIIMDYSIYDAIEAGFNKVIFVIRKDLEKDFKEVIGNRIEKVVNVEYAYQELDDIPKQYQEKFKGRTKPWGTGQAILACRDLIREPFLVINADDYYGKEAYQKAYHYLMDRMSDDNLENRQAMDMCMIGFVLKNTLSKNGTVTRGVCKVDENHMLAEIEETYEIRQESDCAVAVREGEQITLPLESAVSMNMWGLSAEFLDVLEKGFQEFLDNLDEDEGKKEYLLPKIIGNMLKEGTANVKVLPSNDRWFGVTYKEDKEAVVHEIRELIASGVYPERLF